VVRNGFKKGDWTSKITGPVPFFETVPKRGTAVIPVRKKIPLLELQSATGYNE
jgi:hypothetical protein